MPGPVMHRTGCCGCGSSPCGQICFHVTSCGAAGASGVTIVVTLGGVPIAGSPLTTDASGNACVDIYTAGTYAYSATKGSTYATATGTVVATCTTNNKSVAMTEAAGYLCCDPDLEPIPAALYLSSGMGSITLPGAKPIGICGWGLNTFPASPSCPTSPDFSNIKYSLALTGGGTTWELQIQWKACLVGGLFYWASGPWFIYDTATKPYAGRPINLTFNYPADFTLSSITATQPPFGTITVTE